MRAAVLRKMDSFFPSYASTRLRAMDDARCRLYANAKRKNDHDLYQWVDGSTPRLILAAMIADIPDSLGLQPALGAVLPTDAGRAFAPGIRPSLTIYF